MRLRVGLREIVDAFEQVAQQRAGAQALHLVTPLQLDVLPGGECVQPLQHCGVDPVGLLEVMLQLSGYKFIRYFTNVFWCRVWRKYD